MNTITEINKNQKVADFRFALIAELANPHLPAGMFNSMIQQKATMKYNIPYSTRQTVGVPTIRKWLYTYKKYGKNALQPKGRNDAGKSRSISDADREIIVEHLIKYPECPALSLLRKLKAEGKVSPYISNSALSRLLASDGIAKKDRIATILQKEKTLKFNFQYPLECVQVDFLHAFPIPNASGKRQKALLIAFIDDATRRIVYADFSFSEHSLAFEKGILHILKSQGKIQKLYTDNGSTFVSNQTQRILDILSIPLIHSKPGRPQGRGKIERFFRTVRDQFLRTLDQNTITSLAQLNALFRTWLESEYHRNPHSGLDNKTPLDVWLSKTQFLIPSDPTIDLEGIFYHREKRKVYRDSIITVKNILFEVDSTLIGKTVQVYYNPHEELKKVKIYVDNQYYADALPVNTYDNTRVKRNVDTKQFETIEPNTSIDTSISQPQSPVNAALNSISKQ
jgi:transposase InsO family protein